MPWPWCAAATTAASASAAAAAVRPGSRCPTISRSSSASTPLAPPGPASALQRQFHANISQARCCTHSGKEGCTLVSAAAGHAVGGLPLIRWSDVAGGVGALCVLLLPSSCRPHLTLFKTAGCRGFADTALQGGAGSCTGAPSGPSSRMVPLTPAVTWCGHGAMLASGLLLPEGSTCRQKVVRAAV